MSTVPFTEWLSEHRNGLAEADLADALRDLVSACALTKKPGKLTLTLDIKPSGETLLVTDKIVVKAPEELESKAYFVDAEGNLTRNHPLQPSLPGTENTLR